MLTDTHTSRSLERRRVYLGEGLGFQIESETAWMEGEAIDLTHEGLGVAVTLATDVLLPAVGESVSVRYTGRGASGTGQQAVVRHVGSLQTARGTLPRIGLSLVPDTTTVADVDRRQGAAIRARGAAGVRGRLVSVVLRRDACISGSCRSVPAA